jgi:multicomponent Na+:H+ antiporter subunit F
MTPILDLATHLALLMMALGLLLALLRLARGPSLADRVVALDLVAMLTVGFVAVEALRSGEAVLLRPALVVGLLGFLATLAFARYLAREGGGAARPRDAAHREEAP